LESISGISRVIAQAQAQSQAQAQGDKRRIVDVLKLYFRLGLAHSRAKNGNFYIP
jgi:hypothetical protein